MRHIQLAHFFCPPRIPYFCAMQHPEEILLSTAYFPPMSWFGIASLADTILIDTHETYQRQTFRNRCSVLGSQGLIDLSLPIYRPNGSKSKSSEVLPSFTDSWQNIHWRTLCTNYNASPYFLYYQDDIKEIIYSAANFKSLAAFNEHIILYFVKKCGLKCIIRPSDQFIDVENKSNDWRFRISPKKKEVFTPEIFPVYIQVFGSTSGFVPNLSILDGLFNLGPELGAYIRTIGQNIMKDIRF